MKSKTRANCAAGSRRCIQTSWLFDIRITNARLSRRPGDPSTPRLRRGHDRGAPKL
jgi:hypothetical protein